MDEKVLVKLVMRALRAGDWREAQFRFGRLQAFWEGMYQGKHQRLI
jgi:hypothetical protein